MDPLTILTSPAFEVPTVPPASEGIAWLRATVGRFSNGPDHVRRRALSVAILDAIPPSSLRSAPGDHPVATLARAMGITSDITSLIVAVAQAYQPGTGDDSRADRAVEVLVPLLGDHDEATAARIGVLVQACDATVALMARLRDRPLAEVLAEDPPVRSTKRVAVGSSPGEVVVVPLTGGELAFGAGRRRCPGRRHALALAGVAESAEDA